MSLFIACYDTNHHQRDFKEELQRSGWSNTICISGWVYELSDTTLLWSGTGRKNAVDSFHRAAAKMPAGFEVTRELITSTDALPHVSSKEPQRAREPANASERLLWAVNPLLPKP